MKPRLCLVMAVLSFSGHGFTETPKKPVLFIPLAQPELAVNIVKECPAVEVTYLQDKANFVIGWGLSEKENRNDWVLYTADGHLVGSGETVRVSATAHDVCKTLSAK